MNPPQTSTCLFPVAMKVSHRSFHFRNQSRLWAGWAMPVVAALLLGSGLQAQAALLAHEEFDYAPGVTLVDPTGIGRNGGTGFGGRWTNGYFAGTNFLVEGGSLAYPALRTAGNHVGCQVQGSTEASRPLANLMGTDGTTRYISFIFRPASGTVRSIFALKSYNARVIMAGDDNGRYGIWDDAGRAVYASDPAVPGQAALLVLKAEFAAGCDRFTLFVNPPAGQPEPISTTVKTDTDAGVINALSILVYGTGDFDEIRVGEVYADVVPWRDPGIVSQPQGGVVIAGADVFLTVNAIGQTALAYQWRFHDINLIDATNATLALPNVQLAMTGNYTVVVTNAGGAVTSAPALLTVVPLLIEDQPDSLAVGAGTTATFSVGAVSTAPLTYQWLFNNYQIIGASSASLVLPNVQSSVAGLYSVVVGNRYGSATSTVATLTVILAPVITSQPLCQNREPGESVTFSTTAMGATPLKYQWWKDGVALAQATGPLLRLVNLQGADAGLYSAVVSNVYGSVTSAVVELTVNLATVDSGFNPGADRPVLSLAVPVDGKILAGGLFTTLGGQPRNSIGQLNADGTPDSGFNPGAGGLVSSLAVQGDGRILVGGDFTTLGGQLRRSLARLNSDGTLDEGFNPGVGGDPVYNWSLLYSLVVQGDGKILVGGKFAMLAGQPRNCIGRLRADGTLDGGFNPGANDWVSSLAVQADGRILVGGGFTALGGQSRNCVGRLNADGTLDGGFNPGTVGRVLSLAVQADGKILVGGEFVTLGGQPRNYVGRLNTNGTVDADFDPGANGAVMSLAVQADGKILVGGSFTTLGGQPRSCLGRLNADGTLDRRFNPGAGCQDSVPAVYSLIAPADGKILVGGNFTTLGGQPRANIARLQSTLTVYTPPEIVAQPLDQAVIATSNATFSVTAIGSAPLSYQWYFWGTNLSLLPWRWRPGETPTNATLTVTNVGVNQLGPYFVIVSDAWGATTSQVATLDWPCPPKIVQLTVQPPNPVVAGENVTFSVVVTNKAMLPIGYQLRKSSTIITNVVLNTRACALTLFQVTTNATTINGPGSYWVVATNLANYVSGEPSTSVTLTVTNGRPPTVVTLAASNVTASGATLRGTVNPNGSTTTAWFEYGLTTSYGSSSTATNVGNGPDAVEVGLPIVGMLLGSNYHYRVVATNWGNYGSITLGGDMVFATASPLPPAPTIAHCALRGDGCFHLEFAGQAGASYSVLVSTNLVDWEVLGAAEETASGIFEFTDADAPNHATCFYRLRSP